ncbi:MAG: T9SS type A sorting domain-containing protein [Candidatus Aegiribacteria sp.]|nr:T9SS type A sorting domain-containing protein [Candidatus Aegiribacteria sp.]
MGCGGGGVHCHGSGSSPTFAYNLIYGNTAEDEGGGFLAYGGCTPILINNTITENSCNLDGGGITSIGVYGNTDISGYNNIVYGNQANTNPDWYTYWNGYINLDYTCSANMLSGTGNITDDPIFVDPGNWDFNLQADSPCIDAGDPTGPLDPDGTIADMGALYNDQTGIEVPEPEQQIGMDISPNPFKSALAVNLSIPEAMNASLTIYDLNGRVVDMVADEFFQAGNNTIEWIAPENLSSGCYILRFETLSNCISKSCVLIR